MTGSLLAAVVGLGAGVLSGVFGVGGGVVTTPAIRLLLGYPELVAVGTPLPVILPTAIAGAFAHARQGTADVRTGIAVGLWGAPAAVAGALLASAVGGTVVLVITALVVIIVAVDMVRPGPSGAPGQQREPSGGGVARVALLGLGAGLYSGFLGLGGGFLLVPLLYRVYGLPLKRAIGTSLVAVALFAVPGSITHWALGHVDVPLALALTVGVVPGAVLGARLNAVARDRTIRLAFAGFLLVVGVVLGLTESGVL